MQKKQTLFGNLTDIQIINEMFKKGKDNVQTD